MTATKRDLVSALLVVFLAPVIACGGTSALLSTLTPTPTQSLFGQILDHVQSLSPCLDLGQPGQVDDFQITPIRYELNHQYTLESGEPVAAPQGAAYLWLFVILENVGDNADTPVFMFDLYYRGGTIDRTRLGTYDALNRPHLDTSKLYPGQHCEGWLLFEVPEAIELADAYFLARPIVFPSYVAWRLKPVH